MNYDKIYKYYYVSDVFVFPTHNDHWRLVINEALACGLPVITTTSCGAYMDLVKDNGFVYRAEDVDGLVSSIEKVVQKDLKVLSIESFKLINNYTYNQAKEEFLRIIMRYKEKYTKEER